MSEQHTPEPWPDYMEVAVCMTPDPDGPDAAALSFADYKRAKSCVDACAGIANPGDYEFDRVLKLADEQRAACLKYEQQRDELLAALEKLTEVYDAMGAPRGPSRIIAGEAIAKVKQS